MRINLLAPEERPLRPSAVRWGFIITMLGLVALVIVVALSVLGTLKVNGLNREYENRLAYQALLEGQVKGCNELRNCITLLEEEEAECKELMEQGESLEAIPAIAEHSVSKVWIEKAVWNCEKLEVIGYSGERTGLSRYLNYLNERSEQAYVTSMQQVSETDFLTFQVEIRGMGQYGQH